MDYDIWARIGVCALIGAVIIQACFIISLENSLQGLQNQETSNWGELTAMIPCFVNADQSIALTAEQEPNEGGILYAPLEKSRVTSEIACLGESPINYSANWTWKL